MSYRLEELCWKELAEKQKTSDVVLIPVGSVEQHGYHLPLGTDSFVAKALAEEAAEKAGVIVTPPLWFGWCPHHMALPGSVSVRAEVLIEYLYDVIESLHTHGFRKFVIINGHRIVNIPWMQIAAQRAQSKLLCKAVIFDPAYMSKDLIPGLDIGPVGHSDEIETSHLMHLHPDLVHLEKAVDNPVKETPLYSVDPQYPNDTLCYVPATKEHTAELGRISGGTTGSPSKSSAEIGRVYHEHLLGNLLRVIESLKAV
ncbi:MAG: creatininase family protein [Treponema sp.]|nr:creatininase family protein [Treponema sp.]